MGIVVFVFVVMKMFKLSSAQHSTPHVSAAARQSCGVVKPEHAALRCARPRQQPHSLRAFCLARVPRKSPEGNELGRKQGTMREVI